MVGDIGFSATEIELRLADKSPKSVIMILDPNGIARATGIGGGGGASKAVSADTTDQVRSSDQTAMLLFRAGSDQKMAVPLGLVARLEDIPRDKIEISCGAPVTQYRGKLMPLVSLTNHNTSAFSAYNSNNFSANFGPTSWVSQSGATIPVDPAKMDESLNPVTPGHVSKTDVHTLIPSRPDLRWFAHATLYHLPRGFSPRWAFLALDC